MVRYNRQPVESAMVVARRYVVRGVVQGVGFRFFTEEAARREGLSGYVRNREDGGVEIVVEGERDAVGRFERAIHHGPPLARVDDVTTDQQPPTGMRTPFAIRA